MERGGAGASPPPRREGSAPGDPRMGNSPRGCAHGAWDHFCRTLRRASVTRNVMAGTGAVGGGIFAKTAKTPPLQSGVCGDIIAIRIAPKGRPLVLPCHTWRP